MFVLLSPRDIEWTVWFAEKKLFFETFVLSKSATIMSMQAGLLRVNALSS